MFELCKQKTSLPLDRDRVIRLMMSFNDSLVAASHYPVQPAHAYICTFKEDKGLAVYIYLYLITDKAGIFYVYSEEIADSDNIRTAEDDAVQFTEDMGFLMDELRFGELDAIQQDKLLSTIPIFNSQPAGVEDEKKERVDEISKPETIEAILDVVEPTEFFEKQPVSNNLPIAAPVVAVEQKVEEQSKNEQELETKKEETVWEPEIFLSKFRMRAAAERLKKNKN